jgi:hypothetical protein
MRDGGSRPSSIHRPESAFTRVSDFGSSLPAVSAPEQEDSNMSTKTHQGGEHHETAADHHESAAHHHREAAKHYESGDHEKAGHHAHVAHAHGLHATHHGHEAAKHHAENHK